MTIPGAKRWFWLSFCDPNRPRGSQFLGACLVRGWDFLDAVQSAWAHKCNPGGECQGYELAQAPPDWFPTCQLLSKAQIDALENTPPETHKGL